MGFLFVVVSAVLFGIIPLFAKQIYQLGGNSLTLCLHRFLFSLPFLYLILRFGCKEKLMVTRKQFKKIVILSMGCAGTPLLLFQSYRYISSGMATTIHFVYPVLVLLGCGLIYHEKISRYKKICAILCFAGILGFYTPGESGSLIGVVLAFLSGITYAFYVLYYSRSGLSDLNPYKLSFYLSAISSVMFLIIIMCTGSMVLELPLKAWGLTVVFAFIISVLATVAFQMGTKRIGAQKASMLSTFEPLTSVLVGAMVFDEKLTVISVIGVICILCAVILLAFEEKFF